MKSYPLTLLACLLAQVTLAQLTVLNELSPEALVNDLLLGDGVVASNLSWNNGPADQIRTQIGSFQGGAPYIGLDQGIILATGGIEVAEGPNNIPTANVPVPAAEQLNADADLSALVGGSVLRDVAIVEFDFVPRGDTLRFRYVFASEEYNDHTCSPYNDAFGFFVSGPGIVGNPNFANNARNVATVPGTNVPVAINTVNMGVPGIYGASSVCNAASSNWQANSVYFVNNANNTDPGTTQFDGFTVPMLIEIPVVCGQTYHIKIAIADAVDDKNDSAVFIEAGSFTSEPILDASLTVENAADDEGVALEGCSSYALHLTRYDSTHAQTVYLRAEGLAQSNEILPSLPDFLTFQPGQATLDLHVPVAHDGLHEGIRPWVLEVRNPESCGLDTAVISLPAFVDDRPQMQVNYPASVFVACHDSTQIHVVVEGGNPPYQIAWTNPGYQGFAPHFFAEANGTVTAEISDQCSIHEETIEVVLMAEEFEPLSINLVEEITFNCLLPVHLTPDVEGGVGEYTYRWIMHDTLLSVAPELEQTLYGPGVVYFEVDDRCAAAAAAEVEAELAQNPVLVDIGENREASCLDDLVFAPVVTGGFGTLAYIWRVNNQPLGSQPMFTHRPDQNSLVTLTVDDQCGQTATDSLFISVHDPPLEVMLPTDTTVCAGDRVVLQPEVAGAIGGVQFDWPVTGGTLSSYVFIAQHSRQFSVAVTDGCLRTATADIQVWVSELEAEFTFDYDFPDRPLRNHSTLDVNYLWIFPDGTSSDVYEPAFEPVQGQVDQVILYVTNVHGCEASAIEFYDPPVQLYIPTAFTPDGDGLNDVFRAVGHNVASFHMVIFDRGGHVVFETENIEEGWGGEGARNSRHVAGDNMFPYRYKATSWSGQIHEGHGVVTLLR